MHTQGDDHDADQAETPHLPTPHTRLPTGPFPQPPHYVPQRTGCEQPDILQGTKLTTKRLLWLIIRQQMDKNTTRNLLQILEQRLANSMDETYSVRPLDPGGHYRILTTLVFSGLPVKTVPAIVRMLQRSQFPADTHPNRLVAIMHKWSRLKIGGQFPVHKVLSSVAPHLKYTADVRARRTMQHPEHAEKELSGKAVVQLLYMMASSSPPNYSYFDALGDALRGQIRELPAPQLMLLLKGLSRYRKCPPGVYINTLLKSLEPSMTAGSVSALTVLSLTSSIISSIDPAEKKRFSGLIPFAKKLVQQLDSAHRPEHLVAALAALRQPLDHILPNHKDAEMFATWAVRVLPQLTNVQVVLVAMLLGNWHPVRDCIDMWPVIARLEQVAGESETPQHQRATLLVLAQMLGHATRGAAVGGLNAEPLWGYVPWVGVTHLAGQILTSHWVWGHNSWPSAPDGAPG